MDADCGADADNVVLGVESVKLGFGLVVVGYAILVVVVVVDDDVVAVVFGGGGPNGIALFVCEPNFGILTS